MLENEDYTNRLNNWYNFCSNNNIVSNLKIDNLFDICKNLDIS